MKISQAVVRRLRTDRGWSQDQLATASGISLRTIQRVEAEGTASRETRVSLAATFSVPLAELIDESSEKKSSLTNQAQQIGLLIIGLVILTCVVASESGRLPGSPMSDALAVLNALMGAVGALLAIPAAIQLISKGHYAGVTLAALGTPLAVMMFASFSFGFLQGHTPTWQAVAIGICGIALLLMAFRMFTQPNRSVAGA